MSLEAHSLLSGRYRIQKKLAQSGMGAIYLAHDEVLNVDLAIKENLYTTADHSRQFRREATLLAKLRHPNLPRVIDHFVVEGVGEYLVMDYIDGQDLRQLLKSRGASLSEEEAVRIGVVVCEALAYLHALTPPIIHRDIKPANLKLTLEGHVVLVDFGLAKILTPGEMTAAGAQGITAGYSPVEQYGQGTDTRSDIYALASTLYTTLTRQVPPESLARALGSDPLPPIEQFNADVSLPVRDVVLRGMAVQSEDRYQSALEFQQALLEAHPLPDYSPSRPVMPPLKAPAGIRQDTSRQEPALRKPAQKKRIWRWIIPVAAFVGIFAFGQGGPAVPTVTPEMPATATDAVGVGVAAPTETPTTTQPPAETLVVAVISPTVTLTPLPEGTPQGGGQGQIAFVSERSGVPQIYLMKIDGRGVTQLTGEAEGACQPEWAPDGEKLAYISPCTGLQERYDGASIFILTLETGRTDLISSFATGDYDPAWSPDGSQLAFTSLQTGKPQIFIYEFDTGETHRLMNRTTINRMPAWSPDGAQILFVSPSPVTNRPILFVVDAQGQGEPRAVLGQNYSEAYRPAWSPEGDLVLFDLGKGPVLGGRLLVNNQDVPITTALQVAQTPAFSADAAWVICDGVRNGSSREIFLMLRTGARLIALTDDPAADYQPAWRP